MKRGNITKIVAILLLLVVSVLSSEKAFAGGIWTDSGSGSGSGDSGNWYGSTDVGVSYFWTTVVAWFEYTYDDPNYEGEASVPGFNRGGLKAPGVTVPADCAKGSTKFYSAGAVGYKRPSWDTGKNAAVADFYNANGNTQQLGVYHRGSTSDYVGATSKSLSYAYDTAFTITGSTWPTYVNGNYVSNRVATGRIVTYSEANAAWKAALARQGESEYELSAAKNGDKGVTTFCAYDQLPPPGTEQSAAVTINAKGTGGEGSNNSGSGSTPLVTVHSPKVDFWSSYVYTREDSSNAMSFYAKISALNSSYPSGDGTLISYSAGSATASATSGTASSPTKITLSEPNKEYTYCSSTKYPVKITDTENKKVSDSDPEAKACIKVKWDPVVSKIQSKTKISAAGKSAESDWDSYAVLDLGTAKPNADEYNKSIAYGSNKFNVTWTHTLKVTGQQYYTKLESGSGYGGIINNSPVKLHARPADTGSLTGLDKQIQSVTPNSMRTINSWDASIFKDSSLPSRYMNGKISETGNVFPGQKLDSVSEFVFHDSEVYGDLKSYNDNFNDKESHAALTGVANYAECKLTGPEGKDVTYYIGIEGAANDYAGLYLDSSKGRTIVGDGSDKTTDVVWLKGDESSATLYYEACFGAQIAEDAAGGEGIDRFLLNTSGETLSNLPYDSKDPYFGASSPINETVYTGRTSSRVKENKNILANEMGDGTVKGRLDSGYEVTAHTKSFKPSVLLGQSNLSYIAKTNGVSSVSSSVYAITTNVPYNYILDPQPATGSLGQDLSMVTVGTPINFKAKIAVSPRKNKDVQDSEYNTSTKTTTIKANVFTVGPDESIADITGEPGATYKVFNVHGKGQDASIADLVGHNTVPSVEDAVENKVISASGTTIDTPKDKVFADTIGQKYCMAVAVYPADSHNTETTDIEKNADQSVALSGDNAGDGAYWRVSISCRTVAKYPSMSVEGSALHARGDIKTTKTTVNGNVFGSWAEYGIIAGSSTMASGATLAYAGPQFEPNLTDDAGGMPISDTVKRHDIESVGNIDPNANAGTPESVMVSDEIAKFKDKLSKYRSDSYEGMLSDADGKICAKTENGIFRVWDNASAIDLEAYINGYTNNAGGFDVLAVTYKGTLKLTKDIKKESGVAKTRQIIIFADDIEISNNVKQIDAWLVVDGNIDTCLEKDVGDLTIDDCNNELIVNGAVVSDSLELDRTYGSESEGGNPNGNIRRGEVFNYDPSSVQWAYKESLKESKTEIQYVKERAVRY